MYNYCYAEHVTCVQHCMLWYGSGVTSWQLSLEQHQLNQCMCHCICVDIQYMSCTLLSILVQLCTWSACIHMVHWLWYIEQLIWFLMYHHYHMQWTLCNVHSCCLRQAWQHFSNLTALLLNRESKTSRVWDILRNWSHYWGRWCLKSLWLCKQVIMNMMLCILYHHCPSHAHATVYIYDIIVPTLNHISTLG